MAASEIIELLSNKSSRNAGTGSCLNKSCFLAIAKWNLDQSHVIGLELSNDRFYDVRFEVFTVVTMKNDVVWVVTPCGSCTRRNNPEDTILDRFYLPLPIKRKAKYYFHIVLKIQLNNHTTRKCFINQHNISLLRMPSFGIRRCVAFVRADFSEEIMAFIIRVEKINEIQ
jgi:hypothetical protein